MGVAHRLGAVRRARAEDEDGVVGLADTSAVGRRHGAGAVDDAPAAPSSVEVEDAGRAEALAPAAPAPGPSATA